MFTNHTKLTSCVVVALNLLTASHSYAVEPLNHVLVSIFFDGAVLKDCSAVKTMSLRECEEKRYFILYMVTKLSYAYRNASLGWMDSVAGSKAGFDTVPPELTRNVTNKANETSAVDFFRYDAPIFQACLRKSCGELIDVSSETQLDLSSRWFELSGVFSCGSQFGLSSYAFKEAQRGVYGVCLSANTSNEVLEIGIRLSLPNGKF